MSVWCVFVCVCACSVCVCLSQLHAAAALYNTVYWAERRCSFFRPPMHVAVEQLFRLRLARHRLLFGTAGVIATTRDPCCPERVPTPFPSPPLPPSAPLPRVLCSTAGVVDTRPHYRYTQSAKEVRDIKADALTALGVPKKLALRMICWKTVRDTHGIPKWRDSQRHLAGVADSRW